MIPEMNLLTLIHGGDEGGWLGGWLGMCREWDELVGSALGTGGDEEG